MKKIAVIMSVCLLITIGFTGCITTSTTTQVITATPTTVTQFVTATVTATPNTLRELIIPADGSSYIVTDASKTADPQGLRNQNYSSQNSITIKYQWDITGTEQIVSVGLVQFDLSSLNGKDIKSATLQMYVTSANLSQATRLVDISQITSVWNEQTVTYNNKPTWNSSSASCAISGAGVWSSWDVTSSVQQATGTGVVSYAAGLDTMVDKSQEQILYSSRQVSAQAPRLIITYMDSQAK
jgi:hypothetical protein